MWFSISNIEFPWWAYCHFIFHLSFSWTSLTTRRILIILWARKLQNIHIWRERKLFEYMGLLQEPNIGSQVHVSEKPVVLHFCCLSTKWGSWIFATQGSIFGSLPAVLTPYMSHQIYKVTITMSARGDLEVANIYSISN